MNHTKGEWKFSSTEKVINGYSEMHGGICAIPNGGKHTKEHEANAQLITAAPDMLEVLTTLVTFLKTNGFNAHHIYKAYVSKAEMAIKKATFQN